MKDEGVVVSRLPSVCFVAASGYPVLSGDRRVRFAGGAEVQQARIAVALAARGWDVSMISMDFGQREGERVRGVRQIVMHAPDEGVPVLRYLHPRLTSLWRALGRADAQIYYHRASGAATGFVVAFARRHGRASVFAGAHDGDFDPALPLIRYGRDRAIYRWGLRHVDKVVVQSERQRALLHEHFGRHDAIRIDSGYDHVGEPARHDGVVLWCATVKPHKRPELFLDLAAAFPQRRFRLVGGPGRGADEQACWRALEQRAASLPNVELTGFVPVADVEACFDGAAVFVNTSVGEGFPNTFLQAWARGMPTVSFFDPQVEFEGRPVGCVVPDLAAMRDRVAALLSDRALWLESGARARRVFELRYSMERTGDAYERTFLSLLPPRSAVAPCAHELA